LEAKDISMFITEENIIIITVASVGGMTILGFLFVCHQYCNKRRNRVKKDKNQ